MQSYAALYSLTQPDAVLRSSSLGCLLRWAPAQGLLAFFGCQGIAGALPLRPFSSLTPLTAASCQ